MKVINIKQNRNILVKALESGRYNQHDIESHDTIHLRDGNNFSLYGVACDVSNMGYWDGNNYIVRGQAHTRALPHDVSDWLGLMTGNIINDRISFAFLNFKPYDFNVVSKVISVTRDMYK